MHVDHDKPTPNPEHMTLSPFFTLPELIAPFKAIGIDAETVFPTDSILAGNPPFPDFTCVEDIVVNGIIDTNDILMMLSQYGCQSGCAADINGDGSVTTSDVLALLAVYGQPC